MSEKGYLFELFTSIQGEGFWTGRMHHFVRLAGCGVGCAYCDTLAARDRVSRFEDPFSKPIAWLDNPVDAAKATELVKKLEQNLPGAQALAVTGGEPLEQVEFLEGFLPLVKREVLHDRPVLLETAGLHVEAMERIRDVVDMVSMDIKLPSTSGMSDLEVRHRAFLEKLSSRRFYVKAVVTPETPIDEIRDAARWVADRDGTIPFFLQPESKKGMPAIGNAPVLSWLTPCWKAAKEFLKDVRIQPQLHKLLNVR